MYSLQLQRGMHGLSCECNGSMFKKRWSLKKIDLWMHRRKKTKLPKLLWRRGKTCSSTEFKLYKFKMYQKSFQESHQLHQIFNFNAQIEESLLIQTCFMLFKSYPQVSRDKISEPTIRVDFTQIPFTCCTGQCSLPVLAFKG